MEITNDSKIINKIYIRYNLIKFTYFTSIYYPFIDLEKIKIDNPLINDFEINYIIQTLKRENIELYGGCVYG